MSTKSDPTSTSLIQRLSDPEDRDAWQRCLDIYTPLLVRWLDKIGISTSDADDATQEIMAKLHREMQRGFKYDSSRSFRAWLYTLARTEGINHFRRNRNHRSIQLLELEPGIEDPDMGAFERHEFASVVVEGLIKQIRSEFTSESVDAFLLRYRDGLSAEAAGEEVGKSATAIRQSSWRISRRLHELGQGMID